MTTLVAPPTSEPGSLTQTIRPFDDGYRVVFDRNPTPMWVFDLETHQFLAVNAAAVAEYGYPPENFLTGFVARDDDQKEAWGRPVGLLQLPDGSLLVSDDGGNRVWRVSYGARVH